jgi:23S rRNA-/tRNA-specific pseudouridylate synthase
MLTEVQPVIDNQIQFDRVVGYLLRNEILHAVFDCKDAGFVGITDQRVIFYDQDVIATGKPKKMVSIPYHQIIGVAASDD